MPTVELHPTAGTQLCVQGQPPLLRARGYGRRAAGTPLLRAGDLLADTCAALHNEKPKPHYATEREAESCLETAGMRCPVSCTASIAPLCDLCTQRSAARLRGTEGGVGFCDCKRQPCSAEPHLAARSHKEEQLSPKGSCDGSAPRLSHGANSDGCWLMNNAAPRPPCNELPSTAICHRKHSASNPALCLRKCHLF